MCININSTFKSEEGVWIIQNDKRCKCFRIWENPNTVFPTTMFLFQVYHIPDIKSVNVSPISEATYKCLTGTHSWKQIWKQYTWGQEYTVQLYSCECHSFSSKVAKCGLELIHIQVYHTYKRMQLYQNYMWVTNVWFTCRNISQVNISVYKYKCTSQVRACITSERKLYQKYKGVLQVQTCITSEYKCVKESCIKSIKVYHKYKRVSQVNTSV